MLIAKIVVTGLFLVFIDWVLAVEKYEKEKDEEKREVFWKRCEKKANVMIKYGICMIAVCIFGLWFL